MQQKHPTHRRFSGPRPSPIGATRVDHDLIAEVLAEKIWRSYRVTHILAARMLEAGQ